MNQVWRRNGASRTWKTRPDAFKVPIKRGLYAYEYLTDFNAWLFHVEADCVPRVDDHRIVAREEAALAARPECPDCGAPISKVVALADVVVLECHACGCSSKVNK